MGDRQGRQRDGSWVRAISVAISLAILLSSLLMFVPNWLVLRLPIESRSARVLIATAWVALMTGLTLRVAWRHLPRGTA